MSTFPFYKPSKHKRTFGFLAFSGGIKIGTLTNNELKPRSTKKVMENTTQQKYYNKKLQKDYFK